MQALGYFRVKADSPPSSLEEQETTFFRYCKQHGYESLATFVDVDSKEMVSWKGYQHMVEFLSQPSRGFMFVVVTKLDQLASDPRESVRCVLELADLGATVLCSDEEVSNPLVNAIDAWSKKHQAGKIRERVTAAMKLKAMRGEALGKTAFGYRIGADRRFEVVPEEAAIVELIYRLYQEQNLGLRRITRYLNERGIKTRRGGRWNMISIRDILRNRTYIGTYSRFGVHVPGSHPAIIPPRLFRAVQERLNKKPKFGRYAPPSPFLLSRLVYCGYCGNRMIGVSRHQTWTRRRDGGQTHAEYRYYQCQSRTNQSFCQYHTWRADELEKTVVANIERELERILARPEIPQPSPPQRPRLQNKLKELERKFDRYLAQTADGVITTQELRTLNRGLAREREALQRRLADLDAEAKREVAEGKRSQWLTETVAKFGEQWRALDFRARRNLLEELVERIVVYDDRLETLLGL